MKKVVSLIVVTLSAIIALFGSSAVDSKPLAAEIPIPSDAKASSCADNPLSDSDKFFSELPYTMDFSDFKFILDSFAAEDWFYSD